MKAFYLTLAILGAFLTYGLGVAFVMLHGWDLDFFVDDSIGNTAAGSAIADLTLSCVVFWVFVVREGRRLGMRHLWAYIAGTFIFGLISPLGVFLYQRERQLE
jgi:hypothetical protein